MKIMMLKTPVTTKKPGYKSMIYYTYYGSPTRTEQRFCPFCVIFTHGHVKRHLRYKGPRALQEASTWEGLSITVLRPQGKHNALCAVNEQHQKGHQHWMCFWDVGSPSWGLVPSSQGLHHPHPLTTQPPPPIFSMGKEVVINGGTERKPAKKYFGN